MYKIWTVFICIGSIDLLFQRWSTASQIKIELRKMHTFGDERGAEKDTLLTYYFAIDKFTVGGRYVLPAC